MSDLNPVLLEGASLTCERGDRELFRDLSVTVRANEITQIHGPNGGGKTTLLRILCGLTLPTEGQVLWEGKEVTRGTWSDTAHYRANTCFIGHSNGVKAELTPLENLRVWQALYEFADDDALEEALDKVGLFGFEESLCRTLSAGQRRRVALARLLVTGAKLWVLDEPFTSLDRAGIEWVEQCMTNHAQGGGAVVFTSHQPANLAYSVREIGLT